MNNSKLLYPRILELRLENGYSQEYVAKSIGVSLNEYIKIERLNSKLIRMDTLENMAILYNTTIRDITGWN